MTRTYTQTVIHKCVAMVISIAHVCILIHKSLYILHHIEENFQSERGGGREKEREHTTSTFNFLPWKSLSMMPIPIGVLTNSTLIALRVSRDKMAEKNSILSSGTVSSRIVMGTLTVSAVRLKGKRSCT